MPPVIARGRGARLALACLIAGAALAAACGDDPAEPTTPPPLADAGPEAGEGGEPIDAPTDGPPVRAKFGLDTRPANPTCKAPARPPSSAPAKLEMVFPDVAFPSLPMAMAQAPGDRSRWFVALRDGRIVVVPTVNPPADPVVVATLGALAGMPVSEEGEGGLLGLAIHPKFATNGHLYVHWTTTGATAADLRSVVSRLTTTNGGASFTQYADVIPPFDQPVSGVHKGGTLAFGPDGFLYASFGDGGDSLSAQRLDGFFGKILRLDVDTPSGGKSYSSPPSNPFLGVAGAAPEVWAYGFRNPFRFSFDRGTGDLWAGDVGEVTYEEIDVVRAGGNYGWPCREGAHEVDPINCPPGITVSDPVFDYDRTGQFAAVTGGVVYRGAAIPALSGTYVFGDSASGEISALTSDPTTGALKRTSLTGTGPTVNVISFAEDQDGEVYATALDYKLYRLVATGAAPTSTFPTLLSKTGCFDATDPKRPSPGLVPYDVASPLWSDGAEKERHLALPDGKTIGVGPDGDFDLPIGTVLAKTFSLGGKRVETRLFMRHDDGEWGGYSYEWNDAQTDATLLPAKKTKKVGTQTYTFPSRAECFACHTAAAGRSLGLELGQLNGDLVYTSTNRIANQLETLEHIGLFAAPLGKAASDIVAYPRPTGAGSTATAEARARSYLHANCAFCHRPTGPTRATMDLRFATPLAAAKVCGETPLLGSLGVADAKLLVPGAPSKSVVSLRPHALGAVRMPPVASTVVDTAGLGVLDGWIASLAACP
ncbi:MAG: PQQ-dependent sugar dehydrogenase [Deltaproteobacteria bacterium]|nr:PQQ-dependent sugar dehydrogenase [Deltaproteobacteria bacterium]